MLFAVEKIMENRKRAVEIGLRIKDARTKRGWSQTELGKMFTKPVTQKAITAWESGTNMPRADKMEELSKIFKLPVGYLQYGHTDDKIKKDEEKNMLIMIAQFGDLLSRATPDKLAKVIKVLEEKPKDKTIC